MSCGRRPSKILLAALAVFTAGRVSADPLLLTIQPIQVCNDSGTSCANPGLVLFEDISRTIWAQADIRLDFLAWQVLPASGLLNTSFDALTAPGHGQSADPFTLNLWFVETISDCGGFTFVAGCAFMDENGLAIADSALLVGPVDILAHELGHNLGLFHTADPLDLMAGGDIRVVPLSWRDIYPVGDTSRLTAEQIAFVRQSRFLSAAPDAPVPEPSTLVLMTAGLGALAAARMRRRNGRSPANKARAPGGKTEEKSAGVG